MNVMPHISLVKRNTYIYLDLVFRKIEWVICLNNDYNADVPTMSTP
jgi:hypothetical protein